MNLTTKIAIALLVGILFGLLINISGLNAAGGWVNVYLVEGFFYVVGKAFVNALKMLVVPLVLFSLVPGILGIGDIRLLGRVGGKSFGLYLLTTAIAIASALLIATLANVGSGLSRVTDTGFAGKSAPPFSEVLIGIVPSNILGAMAGGDMLAIIFVSILVGICLLKVRSEVPTVVGFFEQMNVVMMQMVNLVMHFAPIAVFCLIAKAMAELGLDLLAELASYVVVLVFVLLLHVFATQMLLLKLFTGVSIRTFLNKIRSAQLFAFSTASSGATIPITMRCVVERMGVNKSIGAFTVPFGATINMDGTAMMQGVATVFVASVYGIDLSMSSYLLVIAMAVLASIGTAAVPGVGLVMLTMVFTQVGLPVEGIGLLLGVDRLLDMVRTSVNVTGDAVVSMIVANSENQIDTDVFTDEHAGTIRS